MRILRLLLMALCGAAAAAWAADDLPILVYCCPQTETAPIIDGRLDDPCWQAAPMVGDFTYFDKNELMWVQTFFRVTYDDADVYFAITCDEPTPDKISLIPVARDLSSIFAQEAIEIFLDPGHTHGSLYQLAINAAGSLYDSSPALGSRWNGNIAVATTVGEEAWYMEVGIPWQDLGVQPRPGQIHGFNVCRDRYIGAGREWASWARLVEGGFHDPPRFAHLVLSPTAQQLGALGDEFRKGERTGPIRVFTTEGVEGESYRLLLKAPLKKLEACPVNRLGINFGAPGDRRDDDGMLWLDYPSVGGPSPDIPIQITSEQPEWFIRHSSRIRGDGLKWVGASGARGLTSFTITLDEKAEEDRLYTVALYFIEPDEVKPGMRIFDVALQGQWILKDFDIVREAGRSNQMVVKEFKGVVVRGDLAVTLRPSASANTSTTVLCGIALISEAQ